MSLDEPVKFSQFKKELFKLFKTCEATPEINTDAVLYHPYTIFFTFGTVSFHLKESHSFSR